MEHFQKGGENAIKIPPELKEKQKQPNLEGKENILQEKILPKLEQKQLQEYKKNLLSNDNQN